MTEVYESWERRFVLQHRENGGYVSIERRYFPNGVEYWTDPLSGDLFESAEDALETIDHIHKHSRADYIARKLEVTVK